MKRIVLAMISAGVGLAGFAQTTPTTPTSPTTPTTSPTTTSPTTTSPTTNTNTSTNSSTNTTTNSTTDPMGTTVNSNMNNQTSVNTSTGWAQGTSPYWGWNSYGIWNGNANQGAASGTTMNGSASMNNGTMNGSMPMNNGTMNSSTSNTDMSMNNNSSLNSSGTYDAYAGTAVAALPANVQMNFNKEYPASMNNQYSWNQYGDWFNTHYMANGRLTQYFYDQRGNGYSLSLPVIQTYVPEDVIDKALNKYGARLYSISMVKAVDSGNTYQVGLLERGQLRTEYLHEDGSSVANVWRTEDMNATLNATDAKAAMGADTGTHPMNGNHNMNSSKNKTKTTTSSSTMTDGSSDMQQSGDMDMNSGNGKMKSKTKIQNGDGTQTKIKTKNGKTKVKTKPTGDNSSTTLGNGTTGNGNQ